jgi:competence protein ComEC
MHQTIRPGWAASLRALLPFAGGIWLADRLAAPGALGMPAPGVLLAALSGAAALLVGNCAAPPRRGRQGVPLVAALVAAGFLRAVPAFLASDPPVVRRVLDRGERVLLGGVVEQVTGTASGGCRLRFRMESLADSAGAQPAWGLANLSWPDSVPPPIEGDRLAVRTALESIRGPTNPGERDQRRTQARQGVRCRGTLRRPEQILVREPAPLLSTGRALAALRQAMGRSIDRRLDGFARRFARVLLIGDRVAFRPEEEEDFRAAGVTHILSVSGLHVGLVAATVQLLLGRRRRLGALLAALGATWGYTLIVGAPSAAVRSAAMLTLVMVARHLRRTLSGPPLLAGATFLLLTLSPALLFDLGFQLSALSVGGLLAAHRLLAEWPGLAGAPRVLRTGSEVLALTLGAQAATAPITVTLWGNWPLVAPLSNLLVVGLSDLVLTSGFLALALDLFQRAAAERVFAVVWALSRAVGFGVHQLAIHSPGVSGLLPPPAAVPVLFVLLAAVALALVAAGKRRAAALAGAGWLLTAGLLVASPHRPPAGLRVTVLDVGQGDATIVEFPDGISLLVDGGQGGTRDSGAWTVLPAMRALRLPRFDAVILSHAHDDHEGGLVRVMEGARVRGVFDTGFGPVEGVHARFRAACFAAGCPPCLVTAGDTLLVGADYRVIALWPPPPDDPADDRVRPPAGLNNLSLVLLVEWRSHRLVLAGDAEREAEASMAGEVAAAGPVDYLKAGHHGSRTSSSPEWLERLRPGIASVSVGVGNKFRHPSREVMARYAQHGIAVHRTDRGGALQLTWTAGGIRFRRWGDGRTRVPRSGLVPDGAGWPPAFLDASGAIW